MGYNITFEKLREVLRRATKIATKVATIGPLVGYIAKPPADRYPDIFTVDGEVLSPGDRVLVKDQPPGFEFENGLFKYVIDLALCPEGTVPVPGSGLIRSREADEVTEIFPGALIPVQLGTSKDSVFILQHTGVDQPVPGVDGLTFTSSGLGTGLSSVLAGGSSTSGNDLEISDGDSLRFEEGGGGTEAVEIQGPTGSMVSSYDIRLPATQGGVTTVLINDGAGNLSWGTIPVASVAYNAGEAIAIAEPVSLEWDGGNSETRVFLSQASHANITRRKVSGIALSAGATGVSVNIHQGFGQIVLAQFSVAPLAIDNGKPVYLSVTNGFVGLSPPVSGPAYVFEVGTMIGADGILTQVPIVFAPGLIAAL